jgi:hypothetical protein
VQLLMAIAAAGFVFYRLIAAFMPKAGLPR